MSGREQYEASQASPMSNMRLTFSADGTAIYSPISPTYTTGGGGGEGGGGGDNSAAEVVPINSNNSTGGGEVVVKRKRGRPRKYAPDGSMPPSAALKSPPPPHSTATGAVRSPSGELSSGKKARGRPPGSGNKRQQQLGTSGLPGVGFTPHIITVKAGEDVMVKLMSFSQNNTRALCILSANGSISNVTLRQAATSGGTVTYEVMRSNFESLNAPLSNDNNYINENVHSSGFGFKGTFNKGRFEILSLSGSFLVSESGGQRSRTGGLSVSLAGPDGRVLGGGVAGLLTAAAPVQVIVGSFVAAGPKQSKSGQPEVLNAPTKPISGTSAGGSLSESSGGLGSPIDQSNNSNPQGMASMPWR